MIYHVLVKPGSSKEEVVKTDDELIVRTRKKAHDGEANTAVIKLLSQYFDVPKTRILSNLAQKANTKLSKLSRSIHKTIEIV